MTTLPLPPPKLQVTLQDAPVDVELAQYKRMFQAACVALGEINEALGLDPNDGGAEPILDAISEMKVCRADLEAAAKLALSALLTCPRETREVWKDGIDIDVPTPSTKYRDDAIAVLRKAGIQ